MEISLASLKAQAAVDMVAHNIEPNTAKCISNKTGVSFVICYASKIGHSYCICSLIILSLFTD